MPEKIPELNPDSEGLKRVDLGQLADWIEEYRNRFGPWARLGRAGAFGMAPSPEDENLEDDPAEKEAALAKAAQTEIVQRNKSVAEQTGLSLSFPSGEEESEWALEMRFDIGDGKRFVRYLQALDTVTPSQAKGLVKVAEIFGKQLMGGYNLADAEDERLLEMVASFRPVTEEYRRLARVNPSLSESAALLEDVYSSLKNGCLREYISVKEAGLLDGSGVQSFGPSRWHGDSTEESYIEKWNHALDILAEIAQNPKAKELHEKVRSNLLSCLEYAERDMKRSPVRFLNNRIERFIEATKQKLAKV